MKFNAADGVHEGTIYNGINFDSYTEISEFMGKLIWLYKGSNTIYIYDTEADTFKGYSINLSFIPFGVMLFNSNQNK